MRDSAVHTKSFAFALEIIKLYRALIEQREYIISKQLLRSGTSIGANAEEANAAQSHRDFISKMSIASKEALETRYWLRLLQESKLVNINVSRQLAQVDELVRLLTAIVKTAEENE